MNIIILPKVKRYKYYLRVIDRFSRWSEAGSLHLVQSKPLPRIKVLNRVGDLQRRIYYVNENMPGGPKLFVKKFREHIWQLWPTPMAHHDKPRLFHHNSLYDCSHVFLRTDSMGKPWNHRMWMIYLQNQYQKSNLRLTLHDQYFITLASVWMTKLW